jgi:ABC-type sugar transport system permease subunit
MDVRRLLFRIIFLGILDVFAIYLALTLGANISPIMGIGVVGFALITNIVFLSERLYPWRWLLPALAGMTLLVIYPIGYSFIVSFTNYGDGHLLSKDQVIQQYTSNITQMYAPPDAPKYKVYIFRSDAQNAFRLWLVDSAGKSYVYTPGEQGMKEVAPDDTSYGERDAKGIPNKLGDYNRLPAGGAARFNQSIASLVIDDPPNQIRIPKLSLLAEAQDAQALVPRWKYDAAADTLTNQETGKVYRTERGFFVNTDGETRDVLQPGFPAYIGMDNVLRVINDPNVRDPFFRVFLWTVAFAGGTVVGTMALGLLFAVTLNAKDLPLRTLWRSLLIIPYALPGWLVVTTLRALMNPQYGPINHAIASVIGVSPEWFSDPALAKIGVLLVNIYLGFPYAMLISLGTLQSIPGDMYEAATIDGATPWQQFRSITLPLLLVALAPLLVASFAFNFNNFTVIELFNNGGPPMSAATVAGHTDILLSYTYRLAFSGSGGVDYGFAAAIGIFIFLIVGPITYFNFRLTRRLEDVAA